MDITEIRFNTGVWNDVIESQTPLFSSEALLRASDEIRDVFYGPHPEGRQMPTISRDHWNSSLWKEHMQVEVGYDLPCLLSLDRPAKGRVMFCAQDPWRKGEEQKVTVGTFFGIDNEYYRNRRHYKMLWNLIVRCLETGYDVWVTDAIKLYAGRNVVMRNAPLRDLCFSVLRDEVAAVNPSAILAFGKVAGWALESAQIERDFIRGVHPTARGVRGSMSERGERYWDSVTQVLRDPFHPHSHECDCNG
ncbi:hypothetical protein [Celeribacter ethanolicus]|uniref:hypothetical protein n=1 Tax=Celeribacter ethanolicus TaxID=1758178 RepID=UPI000ACC5BE6|nr:hypothetical protein [Celeribacter ethanolicus]